MFTPTVLNKYWREASSLIISSKVNFLNNETSKLKQGDSLHRSLIRGVETPYKNLEYRNDINCNSDYKVLMLRRSSKNAFMPGSYVFPGGTIDPSDTSEEWLKLAKYFGYVIDDFKGLAFTNGKAISAPIFQDDVNRKISKAITLRITAIRETFEECGILLCKTKHVNEGKSSGWASYLTGKEVLEWKKKNQEKPFLFLNLCKKFECFPDIWALHQWSNWLTPVVNPIRFDTAFFIAVIDQLPPAFIDNSEMDDMKWLTTSDIVQQRIWLPPPQFYEISRLKNFETIEHLANFSLERANLGCEQWMPVQAKTVDGIVFFLPVNMTHQELPLRVQEALQKCGLDSSAAILLCSESQARKFVDLSKEEFEDVKLVAAKSVSKCGFVSALQAHTTFAAMQRRLSVGCRTLDSFLQGGFAVRGITEITGESSTGKTQLCLQLLLSVQYQHTYGGLNASAVYISTEKTFPSRRLQELLHNFSPTFQKFDVPRPSLNFGDNIFIEHIPDADSLMKCVTKRLPQLLSHKPIGLIVIDSIAGIFRADYEQKDLMQRAHDMQVIGKQLHKLAHQFSLAVICVNQVSCIPSESFENEGGEPHMVAALSLAWGNLVTTRLQLYRKEESVVNSEQPISSTTVTICIQVNLIYMVAL